MLAVKPIPRVLSRHNMVLGGERNLVLTAGLVTSGIGISSMNFLAFVVCGGLWGIALWVLRLMAKNDPQMSDVYRRYFKYRGFYSAYSRPYRDISTADWIRNKACCL